MPWWPGVKTQTYNAFRMLSGPGITWFVPVRDVVSISVEDQVHLACAYMVTTLPFGYGDDLVADVASIARIAPLVAGKDAVRLGFRGELRFLQGAHGRRGQRLRQFHQKRPGCGGESWHHGCFVFPHCQFARVVRRFPPAAGAGLCGDPRLKKMIYMCIYMKYSGT